MKNISLTFTTIPELDAFIAQHSLKESASLLIQCFDGKLDQTLTQELLSHLVCELPNATIIGASTDGEISNGHSSSNSLVLNFSLFETTEIASYSDDFNNECYNNGVKLALAAREFGAKIIILFSDPFHSNSDELMQGIESIKGNFIVSGGLAGDNGAFKETYTILNADIHHKGLVGVFLKGEKLQAKNISSFNWLPIGPKFTVTHSSGNILYKADNTSIVDLYREYLGDQVADGLPFVGVAFPIVLHTPAGQIGRAPMTLLEDGALGFGGDVIEGTTIQFGIANTELIIEASLVTQAALYEAAPEAIFIYSCMARRRFLGASVDLEIAPLEHIAPVSGFFTYGEFYTDANHNCSLLNETMTILALTEGDETPKPLNKPQDAHGINDWSTITFNALSNIINKTSVELQTLNDSLQKKVILEIQRNREKDKLMIAQSKQATMGEMMSMIAHQWRQPIATIGLISDNLSLDVALSELTDAKVAESTDLISKQVHYLSKTIDDFSNYFRPNNEQKSFKIGDFFHALVEILGKSLEHKNIHFSSDLNPELQITSFKQELMQVCINIINNAKDALLEHNIENAKILFTHTRHATYDELCIQDNAGGIAPKIAQKIFEPYFSTKDKKHGTGLGLYMSKTICEQHLHGELTQHNDEEGACFTITLPRKNETT
jgi:signal transduction histidine kinase